MKPAVCFAIDIKKSSIVNKQQLMKTLKLCKEKLNRQFKKNIIVPFDIRGGDEMIGALTAFSQVRPVIEQMTETLESGGLSFYLGVGIGYVENNETSIHTVNGSAVLQALSARDDELKQKGEEGKVWQQGARSAVFFSSEEAPASSLNSLYLTILEKKHAWTKKQREAISFLETNPDYTFEKAGKELGYKSPKSTVSYLLARSQYLRVKAMEKSFDDLLIYIGEKLEDRRG
ncbi:MULTISPECIES: SatD family protein [Alteribacter]|uniref:SatD family (SatD) n=1 Tax=Alteribacter keqinensis TaxID=2483800 RepID=A0A3M7TUM9_9BACI|nr:MULTISPECIES: SatD family protein [Alteribacter]MBM7094515.1 hypothetical protein [Alteribacter salitolerans]RNA69267.1 hypothetical protein EBO34_04795 [Alteribacter keqinensis]